MLFQSETMEERGVLDTAAKCVLGARTAPKAKRRGFYCYACSDRRREDLLADKMEEIGNREFKEKGSAWYGRDAGNVRKSQAVVLIGARKSYRKVAKCALCGFENCKACKDAGANCAHLFIDMGIALSSAALAASSRNVDNRMMWSAGKAAAEMNYTDTEVFWVGIPISATGKIYSLTANNCRRDKVFGERNTCLFLYTNNIRFWGV